MTVALQKPLHINLLFIPFIFNMKKYAVKGVVHEFKFPDHFPMSFKMCVFLSKGTNPLNTLFKHNIKKKMFSHDI